VHAVQVLLRACDHAALLNDHDAVEGKCMQLCCGCSDGFATVRIFTLANYVLLYRILLFLFRRKLYAQLV